MIPVDINFNCKFGTRQLVYDVIKLYLYHISYLHADCREPKQQALTLILRKDVVKYDFAI